MHRLQDWLARLSAGSAWVAALGFAGVLTAVGGPLAMGVQIYGGNTEVVAPRLPFPWGAVGLALALALGALVQALRTSPARRWALGCMALSLLALGVELRWMLRLVEAAAG